MLQQAKWIGLSFALHLAVATSLFFLSTRNYEQTPKIIMVVLDTPAAPSIPLQKVPQVPVPTAARSVPQNRLPELKKIKKVQRVLQLATQSAPPAPSVPEQVQRTLPSKAPQVAPVAVATHPEKESAATAMISPALLPASIAKIGQDAEYIQQNYKKEHFAYIRELITKQLVYPRMARKMGWSGKVVVIFTIAEDGSAYDVRVAETSGFRMLDKSAIEAVRKVAPFPKPPGRAEIIVPIIFSMLP